MPENKKSRSITERLKIPPGRAGENGSGRLRSAHLLSWGLLLVLSACYASAEQPAVPAGIDIKLQARPETAAVGDPVRIDLDITAPEGYAVDIPEPEQQTGDFFILEFLSGPDVSFSDGSEKETRLSERRDDELQRHRARITAAVYRTGTFTFPPIPIYITDDLGRKTRLESPPADIEIQSILTENDTDLRDLKKQAEIPEDIPWLLWVLLASTAFILGIAAWYIRRKYRKTLPSIPSIPARDPLDIAESELRDLFARNLPEKGRTKKFYVILSEIVKRILGAAYGIATAERTTIEITDSLHRYPGLDPEIPEAVQSLLLQCDVVKFAKYVPSKSENGHAAEEAFRILTGAREYSVGGSTSLTPGSQLGASNVESQPAVDSAGFEEVQNKQ